MTPLGATSFEREKDVADTGFPPIMVPKGVTQKEMFERRIRLMESRLHWWHELNGKSYKAHYALARAAIEINFK